ncbi:MAG: Gmad2 immunoglobulin-like domain-containing protein [Ignavibacteriaceae bacterium]|nr:Gmad2 immunoglobulin-like domain-containing protein [Ignavibacteriaceae bacterium]
MQKLKLAIFVVVLGGLALGLAFFIRQQNLARINARPPVAAQNQPSTQNPNPPPQALSGKIFTSADGVTSVVLTQPKSAAEPLLNGVGFYGTSTAFENVLSWNVKQADGKIVASGNAYVHSPDSGQPGAYEVAVFYDVVPKTASGTLNVFEASAKDGSPIHAVKIPVMLPTSTESVTVFWNNTKKDPNLMDCSKVYPVKHTVVAGIYGADGNAWAIAMHELLKGPTNWEKSQGYITNVPQGVPDPELELPDVLNFNESLERAVGGSCRVTAIRAQINETWKRAQGSLVDPIISINGRTEDILQP